MARYDIRRIVEYGIGIYVFAAIMPGAILDMFNANQTGWSTATTTLWDLIPLVIVAGFAVAFFKGGQ